MIFFVFRTSHVVEDEIKQKEAPQFVTKPEPYTVAEGDWARFCCRVTGYPRPRVMWLINGKTVVNVSNTYNHLDTLTHFLRVIARG